MLAIVFLAILVWPDQRSSDGIPEAPAAVTVEPPLHLLAAPGPPVDRVEIEIPLVGETEPVVEGGLTPRTVQLVAVYLGNTRCVPCQTDETKAAVREVLAAVEAAAGERGLAFQSVGAALDDDVRAGLDFLESTARFDQVVSGGSWGNMAAAELIWSERSAIGAIPQVVILTRTMQWNALRREPGAKHVLARLVGEVEMRDWLAAGGQVFRGRN